MTASPRRRRRATVIAAVIAVAGTLAAAGLAVAGGMTLYNSTEGGDTPDGNPERIFPETTTGLLAAVDDSGTLASMAVFVGAPAGSGGSIVTVPVTADATGGEGAERLPVDETFELEGVPALEREVEITLSLGIDVVEVVEAEQLAALLAPVGPIEVDLPTDVTDEDGELVASAGPQVLDPEQAAAVLTARDPARATTERYAASSAVWAAVADAVGDGVTVAPSGTIGTVLAPVLSGPVSDRPLSFEFPEPSQNPRDLDVVLLDRAELSLVFGHVAPGNVAAPKQGLSFRVESPFDEDMLGGRSPAQVSYQAIEQLLLVRGNVLSVGTATGEVPEVTQVIVSDDSLLGEVQSLDGLFGEVEISVGEEPIAGVDAVVRLGSSYLENLEANG